MCSRTRSVSGTRATCSIAPVRMRFARVARIRAEDAGDAGRRRAEPEEEADGGRLAGAVRAEEGDKLARPDGERRCRRKRRRSCRSIS